jgi:phage replication-related protein YjqB (UPF0714/DUF867 family)
MDTTHLPPDFREFIRFINSEKVEYLLIGGYAVGFHGAPRFTADMDIWVGSDPTNAAKLGRALEHFGFRTPEIIRGEFLKPDSVFRIGRPPLQIDLLTEVSGCDFAECYARREVLSRDGIEISVISLQDLKVNKQAAGRAKDLGDLDSL